MSQAYNTKYTDRNFTVSVAGYFANQLVASNWNVYWQGTNVTSGIGSGAQGTVTIVPEMPQEPELIILPKSTPKTQQEVIVPVFAVHILEQPTEEIRVGLGDAEFRNRVILVIEGFTQDKASHMAFATLIRTYFRPEFRIPIYDWEGNSVTPNLIDYANTYVDHRQIERAEFPDLPQPVRYYINAAISIVYFDTDI
jgi:hypothetical protein